MKNYEKPIVVVNEDLAEGVYAASGDCYTFTARITQSPEVGQPYYIIQMDGVHAAQDNHHSTSRTMKISFNMPVTYISSQAASVSGSGSTVLHLTYTDGVNCDKGAYHNNGSDNIGLGNLTVQAEAGLAIQGISCTYCDNACVTYNHAW